jgi:hypothetical protein
MATGEPDTWVPMGGTCVAEAAYDPFTRRLWIRFQKGQKAYPFDGFPPAKWAAFKAAPSKGAFYHQHIAGRYQAAK